jgi:hypothetical protein
MPTSALSDVTYLYQILQNIEVSDADYGIYNDVRLLPCASEDVFDRESARNPSNGGMVFCRYLKYNEAKREGCTLNPVHKRPSITTIATMVIRNNPDDHAAAHVDPSSLDTVCRQERLLCETDLPRETGLPQALLDESKEEDLGSEELLTEGIETLSIQDSARRRVDSPWYGNLFDAYTGRNEKLSIGDLITMFNSYSIAFQPIGHTNLMGEEMYEWAEEMYRRASQSPVAIAYAFFKVDVHNIQVINRDHDFWDRYLKPVALRWVADVQAIEEGRQPSSVRQISEDDLPIPRAFSRRR